MIAIDQATDIVPESLATPEPFREWLARMPANGTVGRPESLFSCPIANFLRSRGISAVAVGPIVVRWDHGGADPLQWGMHELPSWAKQFVSAIDRSVTSHQTISATHALALLHQVTREVAA